MMRAAGVPPTQNRGGRTMGQGRLRVRWHSRGARFSTVPREKTVLLILGVFTPLPRNTYIYTSRHLGCRGAVACVPYLFLSLSSSLLPSPLWRVHVCTSFVACLGAALLSLGKNNTACWQHLRLPGALSVHERLWLERTRELQRHRSGGGSGLRLAGWWAAPTEVYHERRIHRPGASNVAPKSVRDRRRGSRFGSREIAPRRGLRRHRLGKIAPCRRSVAVQPGAQREGPYV